MKLYLSSYRLGNKSEELQKLVGKNKRAAVIANACDHCDDETRKERVAREFSDLTSLGFDAEEVDLRHYFGDADRLEDDLKKFGLLWFRGGNVFTLRKAMALSGFGMVADRLLAQNIVYGGYSAGSCAAGPTLRGLELCDSLDAVPAGYPAEPVWDGLGLIGYTIIPHYKSDHPESPMIEDVVRYYDEHGLPYKALRDGEVIVINN